MLITKKGIYKPVPFLISMSKVCPRHMPFMTHGVQFIRQGIQTCFYIRAIFPMISFGNVF